MLFTFPSRYLFTIDLKKYLVLGHNIFSSGYNLDITIRIEAGAFVCGEETALIASIEGKRGMPELKPPYPTSIRMDLS